MISLNPETNHKLGFCLLILIFLAVFITRRYLAVVYDAKTRAIAEQKCEKYSQTECSVKLSPAMDHSDGEGVFKITNGEEVLPKMLPHQAYLKFLVREGRSLHVIQCGGTLISEKFVLTAAHCAVNSRHDHVRVLLGSVDREESNTTLVKKVKKIHIYPDFLVDMAIFDLGLLELEGDVEFNPNVRPICLNTKFEKRNDRLIVSGWGITESGETARFLRMAELYFTEETKALCRANFGKDYELLEVLIICLSHPTKSANQGDSGGPLQVELRNSICANTWEQIGIVSAGIELKEATTTENLQIYTKVNFYIPWIVGIVWP